MSISTSNEAPASSEVQEQQKLIRKQRRQIQLREQSATPPPPSSSSEDDEQYTIVSTNSPSIPTAILRMATPTRLLVCSIGNPGTYINTLHSAGHTVLNKLAVSLAYPSFQKSRAHGNGLLSEGSEYTLWQSSSLMNISGVGVAAVWRQFLRECGTQPAKLVVVHDELELPPGQVKVKQGSASAKGHNGLKSINGLVQGEYIRIGVGIGRPVSREPNEVANYVLRKMTPVERQKIEGAVGMVERELRRLRGA